MASFSDFIRERREALGLTVGRFAELVGRSPGTVRGWERARSRPGDPKTLSAIAAVLDVEEDELTALIQGLPEAVEEEVPAPQPAAVSPPSEGSFFVPTAVSPLEQDAPRLRPRLPLPPRRTVVDRADRGIRYQARAIATVVAVIVLALALQWAVGEFREALSALRISVFGP